MTTYSELPNWNEMSSCKNLPNSQINRFLHEVTALNIQFYWNNIVSNPKIDNSNVVETWEKVCVNPTTKEDFVNWYIKQNHFKAQGPYYTYKDVLRYLTHKKYMLESFQQPNF